MERPKETLALIEAFIHDLTYPPPPEGGGDRDKGEPALLAVGEEKRMATEIHPGRFPSWVRAEGEQEQEQGSGGGGEGEGNVP